MKPWFLALMCAALASSAWGQYLPNNIGQVPAPSGTPQPEKLPPGIPGRVPGTPQPEKLPPGIPGQVPGTPTPPARQPATAAQSSSARLPGMTTICVPEPSKKVKVSIKYSAFDESVCYRKCFWPFGSGNDCENCARSSDGNSCGQAWPKRTMVKRIVTQDIPITKCTPVQVPASGHGLFHHGDGGYPYRYPLPPGIGQPVPVLPEIITPMPPPEPIPAPLPPRKPSVMDR